MPDLTLLWADYAAKIGQNSLDFYAESGPWAEAAEAACRHSFFHWDLEFPDVFYGRDGRPKGNPGFDAVVGNPPYIEVKKIKTETKPYLQNTFRYGDKIILKGRFDIFWAFIVNSVNLLQTNGKLGFLTEDSILDSVSGDMLRLFLIQETTVNKFAYTGKFPSANVHTIITTLTKAKTAEYAFSLENWIDESKTQLLKSTFLDQEKRIINLNLTKQDTRSAKRILFKIEQNAETLNEIVFLQQGIIVQWGTGSNLEKSKKDCIFPNKKQNYVPYIEGKNVSRYKFPEKHNWLEYRPDKHHRPRIKEVFQNTKILVRRIATESLVCLLDHGYYFTDNTLFTGTRWVDLLDYSSKYPKQISKIIKKSGKTLEELSETSKLFEYDYLLAILNSKLMAFYYNNKFDTKSIDVLTSCRIKPVSRKTQNEIGCLALKLQTLNKNAGQNHDQIESIDHKIDQLVYQLYGLTDDEIKTIEEYV